MSETTSQMISGSRGVRALAEACTGCDVRRVIRSGLARGVVTCTDGSALTYRLDLTAAHLTLAGAPLDLAAQGCPFGGWRWWILCPGCGAWIAIVYRGPVGWRCRGCYGIAYTSARESTRDRAIRRARKVRVRLGGSPSLCAPLPPRPRGMWRRTYDRLRADATVAEARVLADIRARLDRLERWDA